MNDLLRRQQAVTATLGKFRGRAFDWAAGTTCVHLARYHLRQMGHRPESLPRVRSLLSARRALDVRGWADCAAMLDAQPGLMRIAPAAMLPGDLATAPSEDGIGSIMLCVGTHKLIGWREDAAEMVMIDVTFADLAGAWRT